MHPVNEGVLKLQNVGSAAILGGCHKKRSTWVVRIINDSVVWEVHWDEMLYGCQDLILDWWLRYVWSLHGTLILKWGPQSGKFKLEVDTTSWQLQ